MFALKGVAGREGGDVACVWPSVFSCTEKASPGRSEIITSPGTRVKSEGARPSIRSHTSRTLLKKAMSVIRE
jgi:hypothetical protein